MLRSTSKRVPNFVDPSGAFMLELVTAMERGHFEDHGEVASFRHKCQFGASLESSVEGLHATNARVTNRARNHTEAHLSVNGARKIEIADKLSTADGTARLAQRLAQCCNPPSCLHALGLQNHPRCRDSLRPNGLDPKFPHSLTTKIIYQNDAYTQFQDLPPPWPDSDE